LSEL
jgi:transposase InsO family protein